MKKINPADYAETIIKAIPKGVLLTTRGEKVNSMVIGWGTFGTEWSRPMFVVYVREGRFTCAQLDKHPEFTVNIPLEGRLDPKVFQVCGSQSGRDVDKVQAAGLTLVEGEAVTVPGLLEAPLTLECKVVFRQRQELELIAEEFRGSYPQDVPSSNPMANKDPHVAFYGQIVGAYIAE